MASPFRWLLGELERKSVFPGVVGGPSDDMVFLGDSSDLVDGDFEEGLSALRRTTFWPFSSDSDPLVIGEALSSDIAATRWVSLVSLMTGSDFASVTLAGAARDCSGSIAEGTGIAPLLAFVDDE